MAAGSEEALRIAGGVKLLEAALPEQEDGRDLRTTEDVGKMHELDTRPKAEQRFTEGEKRKAPRLWSAGLSSLRGTFSLTKEEAPETGGPLGASSGSVGGEPVMGRENPPLGK
jgi:hypothetical protein